MKRTLLVGLALMFIAPASVTWAEIYPGFDVLDAVLLDKAMTARRVHAADIQSHRYMVIIDYRQPSGSERFYVLDLQDKMTETLHVAHGQGSDPDHDGVADVFSNALNSRMTSLGAFVSGPTYYGRHGLSLRLKGLEDSNNKAEERAIVIHGASYVDPSRKIMGRSWGCPALSNTDAKRLIPLLKNGVFIYAAGDESTP